MFKDLNKKRFWLSIVLTIAFSIFTTGKDEMYKTVVNDEIVTKTAHYFGFPFQWLTVYSKNSYNNVFESLLNKDSYHVLIGGIVLNIAFFYFIFYLVRKFIDTVRYYSDKERQENAVITKNIWKNDYKSIFEISFIIEMFLSTWISEYQILSEVAGTTYAYKAGLPGRWITFFSHANNKNLISLLFNNTGTHIDIIILACDVVFISFIVWLIIKLYKLIKRRKSPDFIIVEKTK